jgi:FAD/FMN-containing dehydrogenase
VLKPEDSDALLKIVGSAGLLLEPADLVPYETAARYGSGRAAAVVRPADTAQVRAILRYCIKNALVCVPQSGNTGLVLGSTPDASGDQIVLSMDRLRAPPQVDVVDRSVTVSAGTRLSELNAALEPHDLFLPIDIGADPMIGGMVATNTGGARFLRYGDMRRHVLGLEVVLPDEAGTLLQLSSGLRKDNAHLDLRQLFIGSCGAFGIITGATLEVHRKPQQTAAAMLIPRDEDAVLEVLIAFERELGECLTAFEGMSEPAMRRAIAHVPSLRNPFPEGLPPYAILVELTSSARYRSGEKTLDNRLEDLVTQMAELEASPLTDARFGAPENFWALRHSISEGLRAHGPVVGFDLSFRRSDVMRFRRVAIASIAAEFPEYEVCDYGHVADGGVHFNVVQRERSAVQPVRVSALRDRVLEIAIGQFGASFSGEHGIGRANQSAYDRFIPASMQQYSAAIGHVFGDMPPAAVRFGPPPGK